MSLLTIFIRYSHTRFIKKMIFERDTSISRVQRFSNGRLLCFDNFALRFGVGTVINMYDDKFRSQYFVIASLNVEKK